MSTVKKNYIFNFISDLSGQGTIRNVWPFTTLNMIYGSRQDLINQHMHFFAMDHNMLQVARTLYFQRQMHPMQLANIEQLKGTQNRYGFKMVWDMDDMVWGHNELQGGSKNSGIPTYNASWDKISDDMRDSSIKIMKLMDTLTFSTQYLADYVKNVLGVKTKSVVIPNTVPKAYWGNDRKEPLTQDIKKPVVLYTGSPTHYNNYTKMYGDWDNPWKDWVIESVKNDEIEFHCMGGLPWFFEEIKDKINIRPWVPIFALHLEIKKIGAHFCINPLTPNEFNYSKSDLKKVESAAAGMVCIGTVFKDNPSPYDHCEITVPYGSSVSEINQIINEYKNKDKFNAAITNQYEWIDNDGRWTESTKFINKFVTTITA